MTYNKDDFEFNLEKTKRHPYIYDFMAVQSGEILPYEIARYKRHRYSEIEGVNDLDVIYYFNVTFEPGVTTLFNHYVFKGGTLSGGNESFIYKLKTGKMWANQTIGDFTMTIDAKKNGLIFQPLFH